MGKRFSRLKVTVLGDDLYCHQPLCQQLVDHQLNFILVCRPDSHPTLYEHLEGIDLPGRSSSNGGLEPLKKPGPTAISMGCPSRDGEDALWVNWCELTISRPDGRVTDHNAFVTHYLITDDTVTEIVQAERTRWKVENEK